MQDKLIIHIHGDKLYRQEGGLFDPSAIKAEATGKEIIILVPAEDVLLTIVQLPDMSKTRLLEALPFALEDQLIADIDTLHIAHGKKLPKDASKNLS